MATATFRDSACPKDGMVSLRLTREVKGNYTLITGASTGIGKAFALECASRGMNLLLVALPEAVLEETKEEIKVNYPVEAISYGVDLTDPLAVGLLYEYCVQENIQVNVLINNAGQGQGCFHAAHIEDK